MHIKHIFVLTLVLLQSLPRVQLQQHIALHTLLQYFGHGIPVLQQTCLWEYCSQHSPDHVFEYEDSFCPQLWLTKARGSSPAVPDCSSSAAARPCSWCRRWGRCAPSAHRRGRGRRREPGPAARGCGRLCGASPRQSAAPLSWLLHAVSHQSSWSWGDLLWTSAAWIRFLPHLRRNRNL